jgi:hypothetical protein
MTAAQVAESFPEQWRDAIAAIGQPGFWRWRAQVARTGGCASPIFLIGESHLVDAAGGEVLHSYSTADEPGERTLVACGNRRLSRCPPCAETYRADTYQLIKAGLTGGKAVPDTVVDHPKVFATFTAPSFGPVHHRLVGPDGKVRRCHPRSAPRCRRRHRPDDPLLGTPLDADHYDYAGAVLWNAMAPRLWERTTDLLTKQLARLAGHSQRAFAQIGRRSFAKVAEVQARGLTHYHAVIRLDGIHPDQPDGLIAPGPWATEQLLAQAISAAAAAATVTAPDGRPIRWGDQLDIRSIRDSDDDVTQRELTDQAVAGYIAKYTTKGAEAVGTLDTALVCRACGGTGRTAVRNTAIDCVDCAGTGSRQRLDTLPVSDHARRMIRTCWELGGRPRFSGLRLRQWAHALGYGGHFSTKSRRYSTTLTALRTARQDHQTRRTLRALGIEAETHVHRNNNPVDHQADTCGVIVIGNWRYAGRGHTSGQAVLARSIAQELADNRRMARHALGERRTATSVRSGGA